MGSGQDRRGASGQIGEQRPGIGLQQTVQQRMLTREPETEQQAVLDGLAEIDVAFERHPDAVQEPLLLPKDEAHDQVVLRREVAVDALAGEPGGTGDVLHRGPGQADAFDASERRVKDAFGGCGADVDRSGAHHDGG